MNSNCLEKLLEEWQERLGLQDWAIVLCYNCKPSDLKTENTNGETEWILSIKNATIRLLDKKYDTNGTLEYDIEQTLVHELLHIKLSIFDINQDNYAGCVVDELRHQLIDDLARALVMAKRNEVKRKLNCNKIIDKLGDKDE